MMNDIISSFNAGELSPYLENRTSLEKYRSGCKVLENYLITPYGPANRRSGTEYLGAAKSSSTRCRLFGLNLSDSNRIVLELGVGYMRFWQNGALMTYSSNQTWNGVSYTAGQVIEAIGITYASTSTAPVYTATSGTVGTPVPYTESDLRSINIVQINNVVYLTHPSYVPMRLSYWGTNSYNPPFTVGEVPWKWAPMGDQNITSTTITPSGATGNITLTASSAVFSSSHVGAYFQLDHPNPTGYISQNLDSNGTSASIKVLGNWSLQTFGTWTANLALQQSDDNGVNWKTIRTYYSRADYNATSNGTTTSQVLLRMVVTNSSTGSYAPRAMLTPTDPTLKGFCRITGFTSSTSVTATVVKDFGDTTATSTWREGAFSAVQGYPSACAIHESRVIYSGTATAPSTIWGSYTNDFENFKQGAYDADSYSFTLASNTGGRIQWMVSKTALLIGTTQDEWSLSSSDGTRPLTPTNVLAKKQSRYGSSSLPALIVNDTVLYIQRMSRKIREFVYTWASETWVSNDLTALAEQTTRKTIVELAYQRVPDAMLWLVRADGQLVTMTYEREQQVVGFARHITSGTFESVATINGIGGEDEVYVLVNRTINGSTVRYIERFRTGMRDALDNADKSSWWYLDAAVLKTNGAATATITGLSHLEGKKVSVWADNAVGSLIVTQPTVVGGSITLQSPATTVLVGLPYTSTLVPMMLQKDLQDGTSAGRRMRITKMNLKVYQSLAGEYSTDGITWFPLVSRHLSDNMDSSPPVMAGFERISLASNWRDGVDIYLRQTLPTPLTIAAIVASWESSEAGQ